MSAEAAPAAAEPVPLDAVRTASGAVRAAYFSFVLWIPIETIYFLKNEANPGAGGVTFSRPLGVLLFGLALIDARRCFRTFPAAFWMLAWYLAAHAASQLWIPLELEPMFRAQQATMLQMAALFLISVNLFEDAAFRDALFRFYGWWISVVAAALVLGAFPGAGGRSSIATQDPNVTAGFFALGAVCLAGDPRLFEPRRFFPRLIASLLGIAALLVAILQTGSRGGVLVFAAGVLALGACGGKTTRSRRLFIAGCAAGALALMIMHEFSRGTATAARLDAAWTGGDTSGRSVIWRASWAMFLERPFFGYGGVNNFFTLGVHLNYPFRDTHNLFLAVLTEVGLVGAAPFLGALLLALLRAWRHGGRTGDALPFALMAALLAINIPLTGLHQKLFWIVFAAAAACGAERASSSPGASSP